MAKYDLVVIGAGPSGYAAAMRAVDFKKKVLLVEKSVVGGAGVTNGALSSKTWWEISREARTLISNLRRFNMPVPDVNFNEVKDEVTRAVEERKSMLIEHMNKLEEAGVPTQVEKLLSDDEALVKKLDMIPVECVVRNYAAGSMCRRLGIEEGLALNPPTFEFFLKNDELHDPMVNEYHIESFGWASAEHIEKMKALTFKVNEVLKNLFDDGGMLLVDFKLEFGLFKGEIVLGDEFTPDGCRLWDKETKTKLDKDRFRQGLGGVVEAYEEVANRLGLSLD